MSRARRILRWIVRVVTSLLVVACLAVAAVPLYGTLTKKYRLQPVLSQSMEPLLYRGDLAWVEPRPRSELRVGQVLVFNSPSRGSTPSRRVIHRVIELVDPTTIREDQVLPGATYFRTQGDNNPDADPWIAAVTDDKVWVQTRKIANAAWPLLVAGDAGPKIFALIGGGLLLIGWAISMLRSAFNEPVPVAAGATGPVPVALEPPPAMPIEVTPMVTEPRQISPTVFRAVLLSAVVVGSAGVAAAVAATFTDNETTKAQLGAGAVTVQLADNVTVVANDLLPGEELGRTVALRNSGTVGLGVLQFEAAGAGDADLLDPTGGLLVRVERCAVPWVGTDATASCSSPVSTVLAERPLVGRTDLDLTTLASASPGGVDYLRILIRLPDTASPDLAGRSATASFSFLARQRGATFR